MLNPSTADAMNNDATIRSCIRLALAAGCAHIAVVNLFAFRATKPKVMLKNKSPIGPLNLSYQASAISEANIVVCAWGTKGNHMQQDYALKLRLSEMGIQAMCYGLSKYGHPLHPLFLPADTELRPFV
jgi:hypothetical protein